MTFREKVAKEHPDAIDILSYGGVFACPMTYGYEPRRNDCGGVSREKCKACWDREIPEEKKEEKKEPSGTWPCYDCKHLYRDGNDDPFCDLKNGEEHCGDYIKCDRWEPKPVEEEQPILIDISVEPGTVAYGRIKDSGARREFETGAVRDIQEGKGRCDLLPLDVVGDIYSDVYSRDDIEDRPGEIFKYIGRFVDSGNKRYLTNVLHEFCGAKWDTMFLEVSKHFEDGAKKYGEYNWQKGIPTHCYIDSAVRHYLKYLRGDKDEPHDRAFVWNILCCIWTCIHKPELNDYAKKEDINNDHVKS